MLFISWSSQTSDIYRMLLFGLASLPTLLYGILTVEIVGNGPPICALSTVAKPGQDVFRSLLHTVTFCIIYLLLLFSSGIMPSNIIFHLKKCPKYFITWNNYSEEFLISSCCKVFCFINFLSNCSYIAVISVLPSASTFVSFLCHWGWGMIFSS